MLLQYLVKFENPKMLPNFHVERDKSIHPFINNGRTRRPLTPIKYMEKTVSTIDSDNTKENI